MVAELTISGVYLSVCFGMPMVAELPLRSLDVSTSCIARHGSGAS